MRINTGADATVILAGEPTGNLDTGTADEIPVVLKVTLPDGVRTVWAVCNIGLALAGLLLSVICVKSGESRSAVNIMSTLISALLVLMMLGIGALALILNFLQ